mmetsp:Transcript_55661/g.172513  ORF Transcript_55661/g.172513 Transcript_55661/m.172513 type:complete len:348 (+) Transcript_55661:69-1112(+)
MLLPRSQSRTSKRRCLGLTSCLLAAAGVAVACVSSAESLRLFVGVPAWRDSGARGSRRKVARQVQQYHDFKAKRMNTENYARWDPVNRQKTKSYEEAEQIIMNTGKMPRPIRLCDIKANTPPLKKTVVANAKERRAVSEWVGVYAISRLQARLLLKREFHDVWGHERIIVYGKLLVNWLQPDSNTQDPMELEHRLAFKVAFRENMDMHFPSREAKWMRALDKQGLRPDVLEGKTVADAIKRANPMNDIPENMFCEAILDNVVDLGEVVLQHYVCHVDMDATRAAKKSSRLQKRMTKRMSKELGVKAQISFKADDEDENLSGPSAQELHDMASNLGQFTKTKFKFPRR